mgnify:FL=1
MGKTRIRKLSIFPGDAPRRMNVMLEVLRHEPAMSLLKLLKGRDLTENTKIKLTHRLKKLTGHSISSEYLENLLVPSALVNKIDIGLSGSLATYSLSKSGERYGLPATDFTLKYGVDNDFWIGDVLGRGTGILGIKACGRRYQILKTLYSSERPLSKLVLSIAGHTSGGTISRDVADLVSIGLVNSESIDIDSVGFRYVEWKGGIENLPGSENRYARFVVDFLKRNRKASLDEIVRETRISVPQVVGAIGRLGNANLIRGLDKFPITKKYEITMSEKGKQHWNGYFIPLYEFLSDRATLHTFENNGEAMLYIQRAIELFVDRTEN